MKGRIFTIVILAASWYGAYLVLFDEPHGSGLSDVSSSDTLPSEPPRIVEEVKPSPEPIVYKKKIEPRLPVEVKAQLPKKVTKRSSLEPRKVTGPDLSVNKLLGKLNKHSKNPELVKIDPRLCTPGADMYMRKPAYIAFIKMFKAARADGVNLKIVSALRTFYHQQYIWDNKWTGKRLVEGRNLAATEPNLTGRAMIILKYSSMPGTSRHHWGTDVDINSLDEAYFEQGEGKRVYEWLVKNAEKFGFGQTYTPKDENRPRGYSEEKWHWSYLPMARNFLYQYSKKITYDHLTGFEGSEVAPRLRVIPNYVFSIDHKCR